MADDPNQSCRVFDLAPDGAGDGGGAYGGAPVDFQAMRGRALELIEAFPGRYRLAQPGEALPSERSDGRPIIPEQGE